MLMHGNISQNLAGYKRERLASSSDKILESLPILIININCNRYFKWIYLPPVKRGIYLDMTRWMERLM